MTGYRYNPEPDDDDDRIDRRAEELLPEKLADYDAVREAVAEVLADDDGETVAMDLAVAFLAWEAAPADVKPEDIVGRFHTLMRAMRARLLPKLKDAALAQAVQESKGWPRWRGSAEATAFHARRERRHDED